MQKRSLGIQIGLAVVLGLTAAGLAQAAAPTGKVVAALGSDPPTMDPHMHVTRMGIIVD